MSTELDKAISELSDQFAGNRVILVGEDPTGVGYYGEPGMFADVVSISDPHEDGPDYVLVRLNFAPYAAENKTKEKPVWYGPNDKLITATEANQVQNEIEIGLWLDQIESYMRLAEPNPAFEAWRESGSDKSYRDWMQDVVIEHLGLARSEEPEI